MYNPQIGKIWKTPWVGKNTGFTNLHGACDFTGIQAEARRTFAEYMFWVRA